MKFPVVGMDLENIIWYPGLRPRKITLPEEPVGEEKEKKLC